jgi:hypothetical protein
MLAHSSFKSFSILKRFTCHLLQVYCIFWKFTTFLNKEKRNFLGTKWALFEQKSKTEEEKAQACLDSSSFLLYVTHTLFLCTHVAFQIYLSRFLLRRWQNLFELCLSLSHRGKNLICHWILPLSMVKYAYFLWLVRMTWFLACINRCEWKRVGFFVRRFVYVLRVLSFFVFLVCVKVLSYGDLVNFFGLI